MGIIRLLRFTLKCIHFLAWPAIALGYPLFASIRAVVTVSVYRMTKLVIYWALFSLISLLEIAFAKIIEWIPFWYSIKLIAHFGGACHVYQGLVHSVLFVNLQAVIDRFYKLKEGELCKRETFLDVAEKYIKENGAEALEKLIANMYESQEHDNSRREPQILESEGKYAAPTEEHLKEQNASQKDNEALVATKKTAATEAKQLEAPDAAQKDIEMFVATKDTAATEGKQQLQSQHARSVAAACVPKGTDAAPKVKEMTPPEACAENRRPETTLVKNAQREWTCDLCKVTTTSETTLIAHLRGRKHKSKCEALRSSKLQGTDAAPKVKEMTPPEACAENRRPETTLVKKAQREWTCDLCKVTTTSQTTLNAHLRGGKHKFKCEALQSSKLQGTDAAPKVKEMTQPETIAENRRTEAPLVKKAQREWTCDLCKVTTTSETTLNAHLRGSKHKSKCEALKSSKLQGTDAAPKVKEMTPPETCAENRRPETTLVKKAQREWTCDLCKVTTTSKTTLKAHLRGSKHKSQCEALKSSKFQAKDVAPSPSATGKQNQGNLEPVKSKVGQGSQKKSSEKTQERVQTQVGRDQQDKAKPKHDGGANQVFKHGCNVCNVMLLSDIDLHSHVKGKRHLSNIKEMANI